MELQKVAVFYHAETDAFSVSDPYTLHVAIDNLHQANQRANEWAREYFQQTAGADTTLLGICDPEDIKTTQDFRDNHVIPFLRTGWRAECQVAGEDPATVSDMKTRWAHLRSQILACRACHFICFFMNRPPRQSPPIKYPSLAALAIMRTRHGCLSSVN